MQDVYDDELMKDYAGDHPKPNVEFLGAKEAYTDITKMMKKTRKNVKPDSLLEDFLSEKAFDVHKVSENTC